MGISGLLPVLKPIQVTKHLSEFSGKTVAVDAYVWLHKAVHSQNCATELATGKPTTKFVKYAMNRIRLMRYYNIEPYVVFDGGPLPAKEGTEKERSLKRKENLDKANTLAAQGKHSQAREYYIKCVDVSPQMAFQFIKALRAEAVQYIVAPYEADAQLAYLERVGLVDAILTEDSDLLVFGCKHVLFKLDMVAVTVVSINRSHFGAVTSTATESSSISLKGWSDKQFRHMAMLSGCDYLSSIPGIGLKTAYSLLKKYKTVEQAVRSIMLEGKKSVPKGYLENFKLAEKCFLHQRVYDPQSEQLVHLTDVDETEWDEEANIYVGRHLEADLARSIALGDTCPVSLLPIEDNNPSFVPTNSRILREMSTNHVDKVGGKKMDKGKGTIFDFFGPNPIIPPEKILKMKVASKATALPGKASGKRTLVDVMGEDIMAKRKKRRESSPAKELHESKFFVLCPPTLHSPSPTAVPARQQLLEETSVDDEDVDVDNVSIIAQGRVASDIDIGDEPNVEQEDGYISPGPSFSIDVDNLSSPVRSTPYRRTKSDRVMHQDRDFLVEAVSSPPRRGRSLSPFTYVGRVLVHASPAPRSAKPAQITLFSGSDIYNSFGAEDIDYSNEGADINRPPSPSPDEENDGGNLTDPENMAANEHLKRNKAVASGWRQRWAMGTFKRRETNVTPSGMKKATYLNNPFHIHTPASTGRRSLVFLESSDKPRSVTRKSGNTPDVISRNQTRLDQFRCLT